ncbi:hypothetical protein PCANC_12355 [Puccinia coronata f. sp. avenae]|uniref:Uncharacterized protein n=1 Tax=Puccinia coronata f. sp. avenae TaxID=200324 RepID=A0A2N5V3T4_9BASI|nr:hypothetical protein PCANC_12355 [Puccinia coronata f. sp. avenae]
MNLDPTPLSLPAPPSPQELPDLSSVPYTSLKPPLQPDTISTQYNSAPISTPPPPPPETRSKELLSLTEPSDQSALQTLLAPSETLPPLRGYDEQGNQPVNRPLSREVVVTMERTPFKYKEPLASQDPSVYLVPAPQHHPAPQPQLQRPPCHSSSYMRANGHHPPHYRRMKGAIGNWRRRRNVTTHMMEIGDSILRAEHTLGRMNRRRLGHTLRQSKDSNANP